MKSTQTPPLLGAQTLVMVPVERWAQVERLIDSVEELQQELRRERDPLLSGPQVAAAVGITPSAFRGWRDRHQDLEALGKGAGKLRRWRLSDVLQWLDSQPTLKRSVVRKAGLTRTPEGGNLSGEVEKASPPTVGAADGD